MNAAMLAELFGWLAAGTLRPHVSKAYSLQDVPAALRSLLDRTAGECMTPSPVTIGRRELATRALDLMERRKITALLIVDAEGKPEGVIHLHDLLRAGVV